MPHQKRIAHAVQHGFIVEVVAKGGSFFFCIAGALHEHTHAHALVGGGKVKPVPPGHRGGQPAAPFLQERRSDALQPLVDLAGNLQHGFGHVLRPVDDGDGVAQAIDDIVRIAAVLVQHIGGVAAADQKVHPRGFDIRDDLARRFLRDGNGPDHLSPVKAQRPIFADKGHMMRHRPEQAAQVAVLPPAARGEQHPPARQLLHGFIRPVRQRAVRLQQGPVQVRSNQADHAPSSYVHAGGMIAQFIRCVNLRAAKKPLDRKRHAMYHTYEQSFICS